LIELIIEQFNNTNAMLDSKDQHTQSS